MLNVKKSWRLFLCCVLICAIFLGVSLAITLSKLSYGLKDYPSLVGAGYDHIAIPISERELKELKPDFTGTVDEPFFSRDKFPHFALKIEKRDGRYFWKSNNDELLAIVKKKIVLEQDSLIRPPEIRPKNYPNFISIAQKPLVQSVQNEFLIFSSASDKGFVIIPLFSPEVLSQGGCEHHFWRSCTRGCLSRAGVNYVEYKLNSKGTYTAYIGRTEPDFPYPIADYCPKNSHTDGLLKRIIFSLTATH